MISRTCRLVVAFALWIGAGHADAGVRRVWAVNDGEKVERDARGASAAGARNSDVGWQGGAHLRRAQRDRRLPGHRRSGRPRHRALSLRLPSLASTADRITYQPPAADPTDYVDRPIQIFRVNYMHVTTSSHASWVYQARLTGGARRSDRMEARAARAGERARRTWRLARSRSRPNQNQAIWVEVYVDRVRNAGPLPRHD